MAQFFKFLLASCLGVTIALAILFFGTIAIFGAMASQGNVPKPVSDNSVLRITFDNTIPEKTNNLEMDPFDFANDQILGVHDIIKSIEHAKTDDRIKGILIEADGITAGFTTTGAVRKALADFKTSGKFIIAYSDYYTQGAYYMVSVADEIYLNPLGMVDFRGFAAQVPFFKDMLDRLGISMQVFYAGKFKSATEPYRRNNMSEENKLQLREYLNELYAVMLNEISESRGVSVADLRKAADSYAANDPEAAVKLDLVDAVGYRDDALQDIRERLGMESDKQINTISLEDYSRSVGGSGSGSDKIAVVYAEGTILDGKGDLGSVGSERYTKIINKIRKDDNIKAVVLRINSPGGSAIASENIWRELSLLRETDKPVIASMGDYAASGGYYIACMADSIYAEPTTLTGSIGVFNIIPSAQKMLADKAGIRFDTVKTGRYATGISPFYDLTEDEKQIIQLRTDQTYDIFLRRVAEGRKMEKGKVHEIAQGRVWTGMTAEKIGLVDEIGGLNKAIETAARMAGLEDYRLTEYPQTKEPIEQFFDRFMDEEEPYSSVLLRKQLGAWYPYYRYFEDIQNSHGMQARLPFVLQFQ
ncbi:MAG: signal peptide peptidase SppA [Saprospiraceae bacterium]|nr:signal peptide peptidase SppA [Saprospiraceae bacterium]